MAEMRLPGKGKPRGAREVALQVLIGVLEGGANGVKASSRTLEGGAADSVSAAGRPQEANAQTASSSNQLREGGAYSTLALNQALEAAQLARVDRALATEIVYGTIQRLYTIDYWLAPKTKGWPDKVAPWVRCLLRMSVYQLKWLSRVPNHAVVDEAVGIAKRRGHDGIGALVNGVLRGLLRDGLALPGDDAAAGGAGKRTPAISSETTGTTAQAKPDRDTAGSTAHAKRARDAAEAIALAHSYPPWLVRRWIAEYGAETAERICAAGNEPPHAAARVNTLRTSRDELIAAMNAAGMEVRPSALAEAGIVAAGAGNLAHTEWYRDGLITVQDESAMLAVAAAGAKPGMHVLDCCAAPGGKTAHLAELTGGEGTVTACDIHPHKEALIRAQADRLGLTNIGTIVCDALELPRRLPPQSFDIVLLDAPCSGFGVIRRKPEIKWNRSEADIAGLAQLQRKLLAAAQQLVKPGGVLLYSTCTIAPEENAANVAFLLETHPHFTLDPLWPDAALQPLRAAGLADERFAGAVQLLPQTFGSDGFFIARLRRSAVG